MRDSTTTSLRTFIGSVVCLDLVGYSKLPVDRQISVKKRFNAKLMGVLKGVPANERVILDTGDGAMIGFLGDPEQCFLVARRIQEAMDAGWVRMGIHLGSVKVIPGVSGETRIVGDATNIAERLAAFAQPGEMVVSRAFHDMVSRLSDKHSSLFREEGVRTDKNGQPHEIFAVAAPPRSKLSPAVAIGAASVVLVVLAALAWFFIRKPAPQAPPAVAMKSETAPPAVKTVEPKREALPAETKPPEAPKVEAPRPTEVRREPTPTEIRREPAPSETRREPAPEPKRAPVARSEPRPAPPPPEPRSHPAQPSTPREPSETRKFFSGIWSGTRDVAKAVGSGAKEVFSGGSKEHTASAPSPAGPPPTVVSRASTFFPQEAAGQGISRGKVRARLDIDASGSVTRVTILSADPPGYFESEATRSLERWKFNAGTPGRTYETDLDFRR